MSALVLERVTVELDGARVVDGLSLAVEDGEWLGLIGPNGAGKTTIVRAVAGLAPYGGSVRLWGEELAALSRRRVAGMAALVPQSPVLPPDMTVVEYVLLGRTPHVGYAGNPGRRDVEAARRVLVRLDVERFADRRLSTLSGGERQRAVLARAVAQEPRLLLLDEPTSALDVGAQQEVLELVSRLRADGGLTVLSAMHDLTLTGQYADRLLLLAGGREAAAGPPEEVLTEELIAAHYGASVRIVPGDDGGLAVVPVRAHGVAAVPAAPPWA